MTPDVRPLTAALVAYLRSATGRPVGEATAPLDPDIPYAIVYPIAGGATWGPTYYGPDEGVVVPYQVTSVGVRADQVQALADRVRQAMVGRTDGRLVPLLVEGVTVIDREFTGSGGVDHDGDVLSVPDSYNLHVTVV